MASIVITGDTSGTITVAAPAVAGSNTVTLPAATGTVSLLGAAQTYTSPQRGAITTNNTLSFDLSTSNNFACTPTAGGALTFTNHTAGQSGYILFTNSGSYAISAAATTKVGTNLLATLSTNGTYLVSYFDNGTNTYVTASGALA